LFDRLSSEVEGGPSPASGGVPLFRLPSSLRQNFALVEFDPVINLHLFPGSRLVVQHSADVDAGDVDNNWGCSWYPVVLEMVSGWSGAERWQIRYDGEPLKVYPVTFHGRLALRVGSDPRVVQWHREAPSSSELRWLDSEEEAADEAAEEAAGRGEEADVLYSLDAVCHVCKEGDDSEGNRIVLCDRCSDGVHQECHLPPLVSVSALPSVWQCAWCAGGWPYGIAARVHNHGAFLDGGESCLMCDLELYIPPRLDSSVGAASLAVSGVVVGSRCDLETMTTRESTMMYNQALRDQNDRRKRGRPLC